MLLELLEKVDFPKNNTDASKKVNQGSSMMMGIIYWRASVAHGIPPEYRLTKSVDKYPELFDYLRCVIHEIDPHFEYSGIQVNKNIETKPHKDRNNKGNSYIFGLGDYEGGELMIEEDDKKTFRKYDLRNTLLNFDGSRTHYNLPLLSGTKYSIIYFKNVICYNNNILMPKVDSNNYNYFTKKKYNNMYY